MRTVAEVLAVMAVLMAIGLASVALFLAPPRKHLFLPPPEDSRGGAGGPGAPDGRAGWGAGAVAGGAGPADRAGPTASCGGMPGPWREGPQGTELALGKGNRPGAREGRDGPRAGPVCGRVPHSSGEMARHLYRSPPRL